MPNPPKRTQVRLVKMKLVFLIPQEIATITKYSPPVTCTTVKSIIIEFSLSTASVLKKPQDSSSRE